MKKLTYFFIVLMIINFTACEDSTVKKRKPVAQAPKTVKVEMPAVVQEPEIKVENEIFVYDPSGRRDPFSLPKRLLKRVSSCCE